MLVFLFLSLLSAQATHQEVVVAHYKEDLGWVKNVPFPVTIVSRTLPADISIIHEPNDVCNEVTTYLRFIIDRYETLANHTAFVHAHRVSWHTGGFQDEILSSTYWTRSVYMSFSPPQFQCSYFTGTRRVEEFPEGVWTQLFRVPLNEELNMGQVRYHCCSTFAVPKELILLHPLKTYQNWYQWVKQTQDRMCGWYFEYTWHRIFGQYHDDPKKSKIQQNGQSCS
jgi:hypothetical protein